MRLLPTLFLLFLLVHSDRVWADGIFGIKMGMPKAVFDVGGSAGPGSYRLKSVPDPDDFFASYAVKLHASTGACLVLARTLPVETDGDGMAVKQDFMRIYDNLAESFGSSSLLDRIIHGSVWDEPEYYMAALAKKEAVLLSRWHYDTGAELGEDIAEIILTAEAITRYEAYMILQVKFNNYRDCQKAIYYKSQ